MDELVAFLRARLDEEEAFAQATVWEGSGNKLAWERAASATFDVGGDEFYAGDSAIANHIARHDPARVLADVEAKRQALAKCAEWLSYRPVGDTDVDRGSDGAYVDAAETMLRLLALPYADHADYREEWQP